MKWTKMFAGEEREQDAAYNGGEMERDSLSDDDDGVEIVARIRFSADGQIGRAALLLASTLTKEDEDSVKRQLLDLGWHSVATEVGGVYGDLPQKITRALVGAALNSGVIQKDQREMHALMHAAFESLDAFIPSGLLEASIGAKIAIVRNDKWISVAVMGDTAYHAVAHHERFGLGVMHI
ncbi:HutP family protein [Dethiosulfovibrio peptidovorans]|nr:HutP family protein [Dethiosulfovibrio peptidovorans]